MPTTAPKAFVHRRNLARLHETAQAFASDHAHQPSSVADVCVLHLQQAERQVNLGQFCGVTYLGRWRERENRKRRGKGYF